MRPKQNNLFRQNLFSNQGDDIVVTLYKTPVILPQQTQNRFFNKIPLSKKLNEVREQTPNSYVNISSKNCTIRSQYRLSSIPKKSINDQSFNKQSLNRTSSQRNRTRSQYSSSNVDQPKINEFISTKNQFNELYGKPKKSIEQLRQITTNIPLTQEVKVLSNLIQSKINTASQTEVIEIDTQEPIPPFLDNCSSTQLILAVDLDETLVHYKRYTDQKPKLLIRNYAIQFLETLAQFYKIVIWTGSLPRYAKWVLKHLYKNSSCPLPTLLTRKHCVHTQPYLCIKELRKLCQNAARRTLIVENEIRNIINEEQVNCIQVDPFIGYDNEEAQNNDIILLKVCYFLTQVAKSYRPGNDIREIILDNFNDQMPQIQEQTTNE